MPHWIRALPALLFLSLAHAPAHAEKNLTRPLGTTRYAAMLQKLRALQDYDKAHANRMALSSLGRSVRGRNLWMVTLHDPSSEAGKAPLLPLPPARA